MKDAAPLSDLCSSAQDAIDDDDFERASELYAAASKIDPDDAEVLAIGASVASAEERYEDALALYERAIELHGPLAPLVLGAAFEELDGLGLFEECANRLQPLLDDPDPDVRSEALLYAARAECELERDKVAKQLLSDLAALAIPRSDTASDFLCQAGDTALALEDGALAERFYRAAIERDEDHVDAMHGLGFVLRDRGARREAADLWLRVRAHDLALERPSFALDYESIDRIAHDALAELPEEVRKHLENVPVFAVDAPSDAQIEEGIDPRLLGLFTGTALPSKTHLDGSPHSPDAAYVFVRNLEACCASARELEEQVRITILHETAHFFGLEDDDLEEMGLG